MKRILFIAIALILPLAIFAQTAEECYQKGENYYFGKNGAKVDYAETLKWAKKAAEQGHKRAQFRVGYLYDSGKGVAQDYTEALKWYGKSAEQGYSLAQHNLGVMYFNGHGVAQDYAEAVKWYRKAAEQGYAESQNSLGNRYKNGQGVAQNYTEAVKWYRKSAEQGYAESQFNLGYMYEKGQGIAQDYTEAIKWYQKAAEQGDVKAQYNLGVIYADRKDYINAAKWYQKAADLGYASAQNSIGNRYYNGEGVAKDFKLAMEWFRKSAAQGDVYAMRNIGLLYEKGEGVTQNYQTAKEWYQKAVNKDPKYSSPQKDLARVEKIISEQSKSSDSWDKERENLVSQSNQQQKPKEEPKKQETTTTNNVSPRQQTVTTTIVMPDVDKDIPLTTVKNPNLLAVIIGNEKYSKLPDVPYAENDAKMFKEYCEKTLGAREKNIRYLPNAGYVDIRDAVNWLKEGANSYSGDACVIFYYAGHGLPDPNTGSQYLLPADVDGKYLDLTVSLQKLYDDLGKMPARSVTVFLDACFSGTNRDNNMVAANSGARLAFTKSKTGTPTGKTVIFSATQDDQTAHPYKDRKHGFFTYFLLKKLQESQGNATLGEIADYVTKNVKRAVFDEIQFSQTPSVKPSGNFANDWRNIRLK